MFEVYIDESGVHAGSRVVTVAAYLARPEQWAAFTEEWLREIAPIKVYHAADAAGCHGEFQGWTQERVAEAAKRALPIIPKHTLGAVAAGIQLEDYEAALKEKPHLRPLLGEPYGACLRRLLLVGRSDEPLECLIQSIRRFIRLGFGHPLNEAAALAWV